MTDSLIHSIQHIFPYLLTEDIQLVRELSKHRFLKKKEIFIDLGERNHQICFVKKGIVRTFYIKNGEEITGLIREENSFFASFETILLQQKSTQVFVVTKWFQRRQRSYFLLELNQ